GEDGEDAGDEGDGDAELLGEVVVELEVVFVVEEELGEDEIGAGIDLGAEVEPIGVFAGGAGDVALGESGGANGESAEGANEGDEFCGILEAALGGDPGACAAGGISAEGEDVLDATGAGFLDDAMEF